MMMMNAWSRIVLIVRPGCRDGVQRLRKAHVPVEKERLVAAFRQEFEYGVACLMETLLSPWLHSRDASAAPVIMMLDKAAILAKDQALPTSPSGIHPSCSTNTSEKHEVRKPGVHHYFLSCPWFYAPFYAIA